jgi:hypothetical protein
MNQLSKLPEGFNRFDLNYLTREFNRRYNAGIKYRLFKHKGYLIDLDLICGGLEPAEAEKSKKAKERSKFGYYRKQI